MEQSLKNVQLQNPTKKDILNTYNANATSHCTEVRFVTFLSGGFITAIVVNPPERKLKKRTSVHCVL